MQSHPGSAPESHSQSPEARAGALLEAFVLGQGEMPPEVPQQWHSYLRYWKACAVGASTLGEVRTQVIQGASRGGNGKEYADKLNVLVSAIAKTLPSAKPAGGSGIASRVRALVGSLKPTQDPAKAASTQQVTGPVVQEPEKSVVPTAQGDSFDADMTMVFASPEPAGVRSGEGLPDADATMMISPGGAPPQLGRHTPGEDPADSTMLFRPGMGSASPVQATADDTMLGSTETKTHGVELESGIEHVFMEYASRALRILAQESDPVLIPEGIQFTPDEVSVVVSLSRESGSLKNEDAKKLYDTICRRIATMVRENSDRMAAQCLEAQVRGGQDAIPAAFVQASFNASALLGQYQGIFARSGMNGFRAHKESPAGKQPYRQLLRSLSIHLFQEQLQEFLKQRQATQGESS